MSAIWLMLCLMLVLVGCAGGKREAPLFTVNVSSVEERIEERLDEAPSVIEAPPPARPRAVTRLVPPAPPRVCQCK